MEVDRHEHGVPSFVDLGTSDPAAAAAFYADLFGWEYLDLPPEAQGYRMVVLRGKTAAGLGPAQNPGPPVWTTYVTVDDADASVEAAKANGGALIAGPFDVMEAGRMAVLADRTGAAISVWQPRNNIGSEIVNEPGAYTWSELYTSDVDGSKEFYGAVFGWGSATHAGGPMPYTEWKVGDRSVAGMMPRPPQMPEQVPDHWMVYFNVADCDATVAKVKELGGSVLMGPAEMPPGHIAALTDPQGATFSVIQPKSA